MDEGDSPGSEIATLAPKFNKMAAEDGDLEASVSSLDSFAISSSKETPAQ